MKIPDIFHIDGVGDQDSVESWLIHDGAATSEKTDGRCPKCPYDSYEGATDFFVEGFDDLLDLDSSRRIFVPPGPPLILHRDHATLLGAELSGAAPIRVGFRNWNQLPVEEEDWFNRVPALGALHVRAVCNEARDPDGAEFPRCPVCGRMRIRWYLVQERIGEIRLNHQKWPGTDLFLVEGGHQGLGVFITSVGLGKLRELGFGSLELQPIDWY